MKSARAGRPQPQNSAITRSSISSDGRHSTRARAARSASGSSRSISRARTKHALAVSPAARPVYNRLAQRFLAPARNRLGDEEWEAALDEGRRMQADVVVAYALEPTLSPDRIGR
jgi:hypothetical protein